MTTEKKEVPDGGLLTVGQFAELVGASRSQLLYYDKKHFFSPAVRTQAGQQASNRRYNMDQIFAYRMLCMFQQMGCTLEESQHYMNATWSERAAFMQAQEERLTQEMERLQAMQESLNLMLTVQRLIHGTRPDAPILTDLAQPLHAVYHPFETPCLRRTEAFAQQHIRHYESIRNDPDILSMPVIVTYSVEPSADGRFPATGIMSLFRPGRGKERSNYTLFPGRYLMFALHGPVGSVGWSLMSNRRFLWDNELKRCSSVLACNMGVTQTGDMAEYSECVFYPVCSAPTPRGQKPTIPGVE